MGEVEIGPEDQSCSDKYYESNEESLDSSDPIYFGINRLFKGGKVTKDQVIHETKQTFFGLDPETFSTISGKRDRAEIIEKLTHTDGPYKFMMESMSTPVRWIENNKGSEPIYFGINQRFKGGKVTKEQVSHKVWRTFWGLDPETLSINEKALSEANCE